MLYPSRKSGRGELIYLRSGCLYICEGYREYRISSGEALLLDGSGRHYGFRESGVESSFIRVGFEGDIARASFIGTQHRCFVPAHPERFGQLLALIKLYYSLPEYPDDSIDNILRLTLTELFVDGLPRDDDSNDKLSMCSDICDYVHERNGVVKPSEIAEHFGYTSKYLSVIFCARYARGLKSYIDAVRLAYLKLSLSSDISVNDAAKAAGFNSLKPMQDFFRYNTGMTVNDWLAEH